MAQGIGRNAPCPCGSGRKYKNCHLAEDEAAERAARAAWTEPAIQVPWGSALDVRLPPDDDDYLDYDAVELVDRAGDELWERFETADYETQIEIFQEALAGQALDDELTFEMLSEIQAEADARGEPGTMRALIEQLQREAPDLYAQDAIWYVDWLLDDALARNAIASLPAILRPLGEQGVDAPDEMFQIVDRLMFHGLTSALVDVLRQTWENVVASDMTDDAIEALQDRLINLQVAEYLATTARPHADDPALRDALALYTDDIVPQDVANDLAAMLDPSGRTWHARDFESPPRAEPRERRLALLVQEWMGELWRRDDVPRGRAILAEEALIAYLTGQASKGKSAHALLVPAVRRLERFLMDDLGDLDYRPFRAGALVALLPTYLGFLAERGLLEANTVPRFLADLRPARDRFLHGLAANQDDPAIAAAITAGWP